jgi:quercetin dioxygenase-like cupin family protein
MRLIFVALASISLSAAGCARSATAKPTVPQQVQPPASGSSVKYEEIAQGVQSAELFTTDALRDVIVAVKDVIVGPGKFAPEMPSQGFAVTELKSGEFETTIDGQTSRRRPGEFWIVRPGQKYAIKNSGGMAVLHTVVFTKP